VVTYIRKTGLGTMYPENELNPNGLDLKKSIFISINHYNHGMNKNVVTAPAGNSGAGI